MTTTFINSIQKRKTFVYKIVDADENLSHVRIDV